MGRLDLNFLEFANELVSLNGLHLTPLRYPQKLQYSQSNLVDQDASQESLPVISHQKIKVDTSLTPSLQENPKFLIHSLVLKVVLIRKCSIGSTSTGKTA